MPYAATMTTLSVRGRLRVYATNRARQRGELLIDTHNLVVDLGLEAIAALLGGGYGSPTVGGLSVSNQQGPAVGYLYVGTANPPLTPAGGDTVPLPDPVLLTAMTPSFVFRAANATLAVTYPTPGTVSFTATIAAGAWDSPNLPLTDEALLTHMGTLFARVALPAGVNTTSSQGLSFVHDITLARV